MHVHTSHRPYRYPLLMLHSWQETHRNPWCNSQHLCCHCVKCWLSHGMKTITCASFNHIQFFLLTSWHCVHQRWHLHLGRCYHCRPNASGFISSICTTQGFDAFNATQVKERIYRNQHPTDQFILLTIEVFGGLHKQADVFLHDFANAI